MKKSYKSILLIFSLSLLSGFSQATIHSITVEDFAFRPANLNVMVGDTIIWSWISGEHTTTSDIIPAGADSWDMIVDFSTADFSYIVTVPGTYTYYCIPHQSMGMAGSFVASGTTAIDQSASSSIRFSVFQNSDKNSLILKGGEALQQAAEFRLMDLSGRTVFAKSSIEIKNGSRVELYTGTLTGGIYLAELRSANRREVKRIIIN